MNRRPFTYAVLQYVHDPVANEAMNIGVLVYSPEANFLSVTFEYRFERLSSAFSDFNGDAFRRTLRDFDRGVDDLRERLFGEALTRLKVLTNASDVVRSLWPDQGLSYRATGPWGGLSRNLVATASDLFYRLVSSQNERTTDERRSDEDVWTVYRSRLSGTVLGKLLRPKTFETDELSVCFDYTFKNERWHVLRPLSLDYATDGSIQRKASEFLGECVALSENEELVQGRIYLLLGAPTQQAHFKAYQRAKSLLTRMIPIGHEVVEESQAEALVSTLDRLAREHASNTERAK